MTYIEINGVRHGLGLQVPEKKLTTFRAFGSEVPLLSKSEIEDITNDPNRVWGRKRWGDAWIKNQGQVGSCNAYAGVCALERVRDKKGLDRVELSPEYVYCHINGGRDEGSMLDDGMHWLLENGTCPASYVQHQTWLKGELRPEAHGAATFQALEAYGADTVEELASGLASNFIGVIAVHATRDGFTNGVGNHAVLVDDVRVRYGQYEFDMSNSWGLNWGDRGRQFLTWDQHLRETSKHHFFYLIRGASDGVGGGPF